MTTQKTETAKVEQAYPLDALQASRRFAGYADALGAIVGKDETLTVAQAQQRLDEFLK